MKPVSPIVPGANLQEVIYAKNQKPYNPLPVYKSDGEEGEVLMRWRMSWRERLRAFWTGDVYVRLLTFNKPLQPILLHVEKPEVQDTARAA